MKLAAHEPSDIRFGRSCNVRDREQERVVDERRAICAIWGGMN